MAIDVRVFPTSSRSDDSSHNIDDGTNLVTEYNLASIVNQLIDETGFVINYNNNIITFNIKGYYFEVNLPELNDGETTYGDYVAITRDGSSYKAIISIKEDSKKSFSYLIPTVSQDWDEEQNQYYLVLLSDGAIPLDSRIHFNTYIDDGDLDS